jgi:dUTPase
MELPVFKFALRNDVDMSFLPKRGEPAATGWDVKAAFPDRKDLLLKPGEYFKIPLGFRAIPEPGWWFQLHPRSSSFVKKYMHSLIGIIDEHFSHEVLFAGQYMPDLAHPGNNELTIKFGDAIGQIIPIKREEMNIIQISNKDYDDFCRKRMAIRNGGFGSTDSIK